MSRARSCTRQEVEKTVVRTHRGKGALVPVIYAPEGEVVMMPRKVVDMLKTVRRLSPEARAEFDKLLEAAAAA